MISSFIWYLLPYGLSQSSTGRRILDIFPCYSGKSWIKQMCSFSEFGIKCRIFRSCPYTKYIGREVLSFSVVLYLNQHLCLLSALHVPVPSSNWKTATSHVVVNFRWLLIWCSLPVIVTNAELAMEILFQYTCQDLWSLNCIIYHATEVIVILLLSMSTCKLATLDLKPMTMSIYVRIRFSISGFLQISRHLERDFIHDLVIDDIHEKQTSGSVQCTFSISLLLFPYVNLEFFLGIL